MADIFISYASEDRSRAEPLAKALEDQGWSVWWDRIIPPGKSFDQVIQEAITAAKCVIVLWSKQSILSDWVKEEATIGKRRQILVPAKIDSVDPPLGFGLIQAANLTDWETETSHAGLSSLLSAISEIVGPSPLLVKETEQLRAEEEHRRKQEQERNLREEEQNRIEAARKADEELKHRQGKPKLDKPEPDKIRPAEPKSDAATPTEPRPSQSISPKPLRASNALKIGTVACVIILLLAGGWFYYKYQQGQQGKETRIKIERFYEQIEKLERSVAEVDKPEQIEEFTKQRDTLWRQVEDLSERAIKVGFQLQPDELKNRLERIQIQLADKGKEFKEKEFSEARQEIEKLNRQASNVENAVAKLDKLEQIEELYRQRDTLSRQVEDLSKQATRVGLESKLEQLQVRLEQVQIQLANKDKELNAARKGKIFVESAPDNATVKILNIDQGFQQGMELEPGKYRVEVSAEGYLPQNRWIDISPGKGIVINFKLKKIMPRFAWLHVETVPENSQVRILNIKPKFSPGMELEPGRYHVEIAAEGYETQRRWIDLLAGHEEPFKFELAKIKVAEPISPQKTITNSIGMNFVLIPAGKFVMGSPTDEPDRDDNEKQHEVRISKPFYLQTTEVSQEQWKKVMGDNPSDFKECGSDCPVEKVSWNDAQEFISKLNKKEETTKYRLPTEAEWEYACRAKTTTPFFTGTCISTDQANYNGKHPGKNCPKGEYRGKTVKVGSFQPNAWGLYDMHGNVWEWVQDWYGDYPSNSVIDPKGPDKGRDRVLRGGSWTNLSWNLLSANRRWSNPDLRYSYSGFRVARDF